MPRTADISLPEIPDRFRPVETTSLSEHCLLTPKDRCYYLWEYAPHRRYDFSPTNQLIRNLKIRPSVAACSSRRASYKWQAIAHAAAALRHVIPRAFVEARATFVPIPGSKAIGDPEHDDRMARVLEVAFEGWSADLRRMLLFSHSTSADHARAERLTCEALLALTRCVESRTPPRRVIVIVDDVLNSGKHYRIARELLSRRYPAASLCGAFLARCVRSVTGA